VLSVSPFRRKVLFCPNLVASHNATSLAITTIVGAKYSYRQTGITPPSGSVVFEPDFEDLAYQGPPDRWWPVKAGSSVQSEPSTVTARSLLGLVSFLSLILVVVRARTLLLGVFARASRKGWPLSFLYLARVLSRSGQRASYLFTPVFKRSSGPPGFCVRYVNPRIGTGGWNKALNKTGCPPGAPAAELRHLLLPTGR